MLQQQDAEVVPCSLGHGSEEERLLQAHGNGDGKVAGGAFPVGYLSQDLT